MIRIAVVLAFLVPFTGAVSVAHEDSGLSLGRDGAIAGLPIELRPARLSLGFSRPSGGETRLTSLSIAFRTGVLNLPDCIVQAANVSNSAQIQLAASWYHDRAILPPYLIVTFHPRRSLTPPRTTSAPGLMVSLEDANVLSVDEPLLRLCTPAQRAAMGAQARVK